MKKTDKLKSMELANKRLLGESMSDSENVNNQMDRLDSIRKQTGLDKSKKIRVIFDGFDTVEQAKAFADWYEGSAEQDTAWLEEHSDLSMAAVDMDRYHKQGGFGNNNGDIVVPLKLRYKNEE